jgi:aminoglycoside phosphotransferase (APT) family kinase protein
VSTGPGAPDLDDFGGLLAWPALQEWISGQPGLPGDGPVVAVERLTGGSQNNIFLLTRHDATRMVLRRPPEHLRRNSNDTMLREARVLGALAGSAVPHPAFYGVCADPAVIGTTFYVMEPIDGFTPIGDLPGRYATDPEWRRALAFAMVDGAAALGALDPEAVGLAAFGKADRWLERQVGRWRAQLDGYSELDGYDGPDIPDVERVGAWLDANRPAEVHIGVIHGDYQFANVMLAPDAPELAAIVDWELSTLGDPLLDLGWVLASWLEPGDPPGKAPMFRPWADMPTRAELVARYAEVSGRDVSAMPWYLVLACYKLGILLEGTHARARAGQADPTMGDLFHGMTRWLFARANQSIDEA